MIRQPLTLSFYIGRTILMMILIAYGIMISIIGLIEMIELIRRAGHKEYEIPFSVILEMTLMKLPSTMEEMLPFAVLIGGMLGLVKLTRSHELVVARASGMSVWQFLFPSLSIALMIGVFFITVFNPIASAMISRFEVLEGKYITGQPSVLSVSASGLWLRQVENQGATINNMPLQEYIMHAESIAQSDMTLSDVTVFAYGENNTMLGRIDAKRAILQEGYWDIRSAVISAPGMPTRKRAVYSLETDLSISEIQDSFASPKTLSFWELPKFISTLEKAGFSALRHKMHFQQVLASPILLCVMVLIGSLFALQMPRRGRVGIMVVLGLLSGLALVFANFLISALGAAGNLPIALAAWFPMLTAGMLSISVLLHREDG